MSHPRPSFPGVRLGICSVAVIVDGSGSATADGFQSTLGLANKLIDNLHDVDNSTMVALIVYGTTPQLVFNELNEVLDTASMQAVLASHPETPLRDIVSFFPVDVHAPYLHLNIDTQEDVLLLKEHEPALLAYFLQ